MDLSREQKRLLAEEAYARKRSFESLIDYTKYIDVPGKPMSNEESRDWVYDSIETGVADHHILLLKTMQDVILGNIPRAMFFLPPGSAKSTYCSSVAPTWAMGRFPGTKIILASYGGDLAKKHGRKARSIVKSDKYRSVFDVEISDETNAADMWATSNDSEYMSAGILSGITGNRAHGIIIDDPIRGRADADSQVVRDRTWDAYQDDLKTRLIPGGWEIIVQCMTGDTPVLMEDGSERPLADIKVGDEIATYDNGSLSTSKVLNQKSQGLDNVFTIKMKSGRTVKANERHPFLVDFNGDHQWVKTKDLAKGQNILKVIGASGLELNAQIQNVASQQSVKDFVLPTTISISGQVDIDHHLQAKDHVGTRILSTAMVLLSKITKSCLKTKMGDVLYAGLLQKNEPHLTTGMGSSALTTATLPIESEDYYATIATLQSDQERHQKHLSQPHVISGFTLDEIVSIEATGIEEVFDIQVDKTENFIANGLVSHNTRWHENDLSGRLLPEDYNGESGYIDCSDGRKWYVLNIPAQCVSVDDPLEREIGEYLWPEWFTEEHFNGFKKNARSWSALFQQRPRPDEGTYHKRDWYHLYQPYELPSNLHLYITSDFATMKDQGDFTEHGVWGIDTAGHLWMVDWWYGQETADLWIQELLNLFGIHKPLCWFGEGGVIRRAIEPFLIRMMNDQKQHCRIEWVNPITDKGTRGRAFQALASQGMVHIPDSTKGHRVLDQLVGFLSGGNLDDAVDVCSLIGLVVDQAHPAIVSRNRAKPKTMAEKDWERIHGVHAASNAVNLDDMEH